METKRLEIVGFRHKPEELIEFLNCSFFLNFIGIYTFEIQKNETMTSYDNDIVIDVSKMIEKLGNKQHTWDNLFPVFQSEIVKAINESAVNFDEKMLIEAISVLSSIYSKCNLFQAIFTSKYCTAGYLSLTKLELTKLEGSMVDDFFKDDKKLFLKAIDSIEEISSEISKASNYYVNLARMFCYKNYSLMLANYFHQAHAYNFTVDSIKEFRKIAEDYNSSYAYMLLGEIVRFVNNDICHDYASAESIRIATEFLNKSLSLIKNSTKYPFVAEIYFEIADMLSCYRTDEKIDMVLQSYKYGIMINPSVESYYLLGNYYSYFLANFSKKDEDIEKRKQMMEYFERYISYLENKDGYLNPREISRYIATSINIIYTWARYKDIFFTSDDEALRKICKFLNDVMKYWKQLENGVSTPNKYTQFCFDVYGELAPKYIKHILKSKNKKILDSYYSKFSQMRPDLFMDK